MDTNTATRYDRARDVPRTFAGIWPETLACRTARLAFMRRQLLAERQRGLAGHWTYDLARHAHMLAIYRHELLTLND